MKPRTVFATLLMALAITLLIHHWRQDSDERQLDRQTNRAARRAHNSAPPYRREDTLSADDVLSDFLE